MKLEIRPSETDPSITAANGVSVVSANYDDEDAPLWRLRGSDGPPYDEYMRRMFDTALAQKYRVIVLTFATILRSPIPNRFGIGEIQACRE